MCQAKPGPRCSHHTRYALKEAKERVRDYLKSNFVKDAMYLSPSLRPVYDEHVKALRQAQDAYNSSPEGLQKLEEELEAAKESEGEHSMNVQNLTYRLENAQTRRETQKRIVEALKDVDTTVEETRETQESEGERWAVEEFARRVKEYDRRYGKPKSETDAGMRRGHLKAMMMGMNAEAKNLYTKKEQEILDTMNAHAEHGSGWVGAKPLNMKRNLAAARLGVIQTNKIHETLTAL